MSREKIGIRIKNLRVSLRLNQKDFAQTIGISQGTLSDLETGKTKPSADTIFSIHEKYPQSLYFLFPPANDVDFLKGTGLENVFKRLNKLKGSDSLDEFSKKTGVKGDVLSRYLENRLFPDDNDINLICKALKINYLWLLFGKGTKHDTPPQPSTLNERDLMNQAIGKLKYIIEDTDLKTTNYSLWENINLGKIKAQVKLLSMIKEVSERSDKTEGVRTFAHTGEGPGGKNPMPVPGDQEYCKEALKSGAVAQSQAEHKPVDLEMARLYNQMQRILKYGEIETVGKLKGFLAALDPGEKE